VDDFEKQNGDLAVTICGPKRHLQAISAVVLRSVTPEVAGSSPVAPALKAAGNRAISSAWL
jgi:hypothetical protein